VTNTVLLGRKPQIRRDFVFIFILIIIVVIVFVLVFLCRVLIPIASMQ
jgi:t-SNARE complex subunit (syntaxin)